MSGNVWEWCLDDWNDSYQSKPDRLKNNGNEPWCNVNSNTNDHSYRMRRGGSWGSRDYNCRSASRIFDSASFRSHFYGFRVVLPLL